MANGGSLVLNMGPLPNKKWGCTPDAAPPSMSEAKK
jgi:putative alpha-1,2-mannosidase